MKILRNNGIAEDFRLSLERTIIRMNARDGQATRHYKPSGLNCVRKMYYVMTGAEAERFPKSPELARICESGTDSHLRLQGYISHICDVNPDIQWVSVADYVRERGLDRLEIRSQKEYETHLFHKDLNVSFLCDGLLRIGGIYHILEIKTESSRSFLKRTGVDDKHRFQAMCYSALLEVPDILFVYENRDICSKKYYIIHITDGERAGIIGRIRTCDGFIARHELPDKEENAQCVYCEYSSLCGRNANTPKITTLF